MRRERAEEIADALRSNQEFTCHKTLEYVDDLDDPIITKDSKFCIGAIATMQNEGVAEYNQMVRFAHRFGQIDLDSVDADDVHESLDDWIDEHDD